MSLWPHPRGGLFLTYIYIYVKKITSESVYIYIIQVNQLESNLKEMKKALDSEGKSHQESLKSVNKLEALKEDLERKLEVEKGEVKELKQDLS